MPPEQAAYSVADEAGLTLLGYIAFLDPPKETAAAAIATLKARGVQVKILTGDRDIVTRKICHDVSLPADHIVLGHEIETLSPDQLADLADAATVFAKVSPSQKAAIIDALTARATSSAIWVTASTMGRRSRPPTSAYPWRVPSISPRKQPISSCWKRAWRCSATV
jgi:magnesium-transporting ATPase (P-type)